MMQNKSREEKKLIVAELICRMLQTCTETETDQIVAFFQGMMAMKQIQQGATS